MSSLYSCTYAHAYAWSKFWILYLHNDRNLLSLLCDRQIRCRKKILASSMTTQWNVLELCLQMLSTRDVLPSISFFIQHVEDNTSSNQLQVYTLYSTLQELTLSIFCGGRVDMTYFKSSRFLMSIKNLMNWYLGGLNELSFSY